ncbi:MAG TPA: 6-carboxytetrahydropterin synthase [Flavitalea sp.]|nr:6-carboxytetrahydropterin synthase [Flavitalea sp.]
MLRVTKIFHFETAHAIHGYHGGCKHIHGHSYELHVAVSPAGIADDFIPAPGFVLDFKKLKAIVSEAVINQFDHKLILSNDFLFARQEIKHQENLVTWNVEPTAENIVICIKRLLQERLPDGINLVYLKLYETKDSYAEWFNNG